MLPVCLFVLGAASIAVGAPAQPPRPIFRNECKDPKLNDCPVETSTCYDLAYEYTCICKPGFVDLSPDKKDKPGRVCSPEGSAPVAPSSLPADPDSPPPEAPAPSETGTNAPEKPSSGEVTELPSGSLKLPETHEEFPKSLSADDASRDDGNSTASKAGIKPVAGVPAKGTTGHPPIPSKASAGTFGKTDAKTEAKPAQKTGATEPPITPTDDLKEQFKAIDTNKDGKVNLAELRTALSGNQMKLSEEQIKNMLKAADSNNDGSVNFEEFQALLKE
jgi:hypothetical protein